MPHVLPRKIRAVSAAITVIAASAAGCFIAGSPAGAATAAAPAGIHRTASPTLTGGLVLVPRASGDFNLVNYHSWQQGAGNYKCIGIAGSPPDGNAGDWSCSGQPDQAWHWGASNPQGWTQLVNGRGQCLGVAGGSDSAGARIVGWSCLGSGHPDQYWAPGSSVFSGADTLLNYNGYANGGSAWLIGVQGGSLANGAPLVLWSSNNNPDQSWIFD